MCIAINPNDDCSELYNSKISKLNGTAVSLAENVPSPYDGYLYASFSPSTSNVSYERYLIGGIRYVMNVAYGGYTAGVYALINKGDKVTISWKNMGTSTMYVVQNVY